MRRSEEHDIAGAQRGCIGHAECEAIVVPAQVREHVGDLYSILRAGGDHHHFGLRMLSEQAQQFDARIACAAYDTDLDHDLPSN